MKALLQSNNYFILITRDSMCGVPFDNSNIFRVTFEGGKKCQMLPLCWDPCIVLSVKECMSMLSIIARPWSVTEDPSQYIVDPSADFDVGHDSDWLNTPWSRAVISDIQGIDVTDTNRSVEDILIFHHMFPELLATGTKHLILLKYGSDPRICRMSKFGENCYKWLMDLCDEKDICGVMTNYIFFKDEDLKGRGVRFPDIDMVAASYRDFRRANALIMGKELTRH